MYPTFVRLDFCHIGAHTDHPDLTIHTVILEEASLELVPKKYWSHESCKLFESRFGIPPEKQILDDNYHHEIVERLPDREKRGRPDVVHFALLDITSTPAYEAGLIRPIIHTVNNEVIVVKDRVRLPRTVLRFNGVMSKILRNEIGPSEKDLFENRGTESLKQFIPSLEPDGVFCLTTQGVLKDLREFVLAINAEKRKSVWIIGGFARGHFIEEVKALADDLLSISDRPLPAHVVTARLSYEIERIEINRKAPGV